MANILCLWVKATTKYFIKKIWWKYKKWSYSTQPKSQIIRIPKSWIFHSNPSPKYTQNTLSIFSPMYSLNVQREVKQRTKHFSNTQWTWRCAWLCVSRASEACSIYRAFGAKNFNHAFNAFSVLPNYLLQYLTTAQSHFLILRASTPPKGIWTFCPFVCYQRLEEKSSHTLMSTVIIYYECRAFELLLVSVGLCYYIRIQAQRFLHILGEEVLFELRSYRNCILISV